MQSISQLLIDDLKERLTQDVLGEIALETLDGIDKLKNEKTERGLSPIKGFPSYERYSERYAKHKERSSIHWNGGIVNLRYSSNGTDSIANTRKILDGGAASLRFNNPDKGNIFQSHDEGEDGMPKRQIFPHTVDQVPEEWDELARQAISKVLDAH